jgi:hypothetical protein
MKVFGVIRQAVHVVKASRHLATHGRGWMLVLAFGLLVAIFATQRLSGRNIDKTNLSETDKVSYALGMTLASQLRAQSIAVEPDMVTRALRDALSNDSTLLTYQEARSVIVALQKDLKAKRSAVQRSKVRLNAQAAANNRGRGLTVSFKLDPRLGGGGYGNPDRWVIVPSYRKVGEGRTCTLEARLQAVDPESVPPKWTAADPGMVSIDPAEGAQVKILVKHAGATTVHVESEAGSKDLTIKAEYANNVLQAEISQR